MVRLMDDLVEEVHHMSESELSAMLRVARVLRAPMMKDADTDIDIRTTVSIVIDVPPEQEDGESTRR